MRPLNHTTKEASDWSRDEVLAELAKAGWSLRRLALHHGISPSTLQQVLYRPYPRGEQRIAEALGLKPELIWPTRYDAKGEPNRPMGRPSFVPRVIPNLQRNRSTGRGRVNVKRKDGI